MIQWILSLYFWRFAKFKLKTYSEFFFSRTLIIIWIFYRFFTHLVISSFFLQTLKYTLQRIFFVQNLNNFILEIYKRKEVFKRIAISINFITKSKYFLRIFVINFLIKLVAQIKYSEYSELLHIRLGMFYFFSSLISIIISYFLIYKYECTFLFCKLKYSLRYFLYRKKKEN